MKELLLSALLATLPQGPEFLDTPRSYVRGIVQNDYEPWLVQWQDGTKSGCFYLGGDELLGDGDAVALVPWGHESRDWWTANSILWAIGSDRRAIVHCIKL